MRARVPCSALVLALTAVACSDSVTRDTPGAVIDTLPNGAVRVRGPAEGTWTDATRWRLEEVVRLGSIEGDGPDVFGQIWAITVDPANRIYVLDRQAKEVRVFDVTGQHVRTFGREGSGPGEFVDPFGFAWDANGRLWVVDVRNARYSVFDTTGAHVREYPRAIGGFSWPWPGRIARDGRLYEPSYMRDMRPILAFRAHTELIAADTFRNALLDLAPADAPSPSWALTDERGIGSYVGVPFSTRGEWVLDADARMWVGYSGLYNIVRRTLAGDSTLVIQRDIAPVAVTGAERDSVIGSIDEEHIKHPKMDLSRIPGTKPFFERLLPDEYGNLWVLRQVEGGAWSFDVFDRDGVFLGSIRLPERPSLFPPPRFSRDLMLMVTTDSLGVQSILGYRINRGVVAREPR